MIIAIVYTVIDAENSRFGLIVSVIYWFVIVMIAVCVLTIVAMPLAYPIGAVLGSLWCLIILIEISIDRQKFSKIYSENKISKFMQASEVFIMSQLLENLYEPKSALTSENKSRILEKVTFALKKKFNDLFTTIDVESNIYCTSLTVYAQLQKEIEDFMLGVGTHDIDFITENTTGFVVKAYFIQKVLNELADSGNIIKLEIGDDPEKKSKSDEKKYIYQHKQSQRPMKSTEIEID
jgi:hypothetical protein